MSRIGAAVLVLAAALTVRAESGFVLGIDYSQWLPPEVSAIATDPAGSIYALSASRLGEGMPSSLLKLSADGRTVVWMQNLDFAAAAMTVGSDGSVYVAKVDLNQIEMHSGPQAFDVVKLKSDGSGLEWNRPAALTLQGSSLPVIGIDPTGRTYVTGSTASGEGTVVRLTSAGDIDYTTNISGLPTSIVSGPAGTALVVGQGPTGGFLTQMMPDGSLGFTANLPPPPPTPITDGFAVPAVAIDSNGQAVVYTGKTLDRFDADGQLMSTKTFDWPGSYSGIALDAAGNAYVLGSSYSRSYSVRNTLATCGIDLLSVVAPDGAVLQTTYLPGGPQPLLTLDPQGGVLIVERDGDGYTPTRAAPSGLDTSGPTPNFLLRLSPNTPPVTFPLSCFGNGATFMRGSIAPGEVLTLFGDGLGPHPGLALSAPYQTKAAGVEVTFDGVAAPLLWVESQQINLVAPWSLVPGRTSQVCVSINGVMTNCLALKVVETSPGVFMVDRKYAAALNQDGSINSKDNPAAPGSIVSVFATGLGGVTPTPTDGATAGFPLAGQTLSVQVNQTTPIIPFSSAPVDVYYAGPAPYLIYGVSQINFRLPRDSAYQVSVGSALSQQFWLYVSPQ